MTLLLIPVLTEPNFRSYLWARQTLDGIMQEASRRKYKVQTIDARAYETVDYDALFTSSRRMLIVIGTSVSWMPRALAFFSQHGIESVFISFDPSETTLPIGMVRMDYVGAMHHLVTYLESCGRDRIALYGYNPNSSADNIKMRYFQNYCRSRARSWEESIFYNYASLNGCYRSFSGAVSRFNAVICANDIAAVSLLSLLRKDGISVPDDLYVATFGSSRIAERISPSLTTITLDHSELGRQAVILYSFLSRQTVTSSVSMRVRSRLIVRASTGNHPDCLEDWSAPPETDAFVSQVNFYADREASMLLRGESLISACDDTDLQLLHGLLHRQSMESMRQTLFLTASALQYRKKRLMDAAECASSTEFLQFLRWLQEKDLLS